MEMIKRHKNKLLFTVVVASGLYAGSKYLVKKARQWQSSERSERAGNERLIEHYRSNHDAALSAVTGVLPTLQSAVSSQLDSEAIMAQLKAKPANKVTLWEDLKIISFACLVSSVYSTTLLVVFMEVQLSILGGIMVNELHKSPGDQASPNIQEQYLAMVEYLLQEGIHSLSELVRQSSEGILNGYSLKEKVTCEGVQQLLSDIQSEVQAHAQRANSPRSALRRPNSFLIQYALPKETLLETEARTNSVDLMSAIRDVLESGGGVVPIYSRQFSEVFEVCLGQAFSVLTNSLTTAYNSAAQSQSVLPLAMIIPLITDHTPQVFEIHQTGTCVVQSVMESKDLQTLSHYVHEAFSQY